jgi:hypothetical protein
MLGELRPVPVRPFDVFHLAPAEDEPAELGSAGSSSPADHAQVS